MFESSNLKAQERPRKNRTKEKTKDQMTNLCDVENHRDDFNDGDDGESHPQTEMTAEIGDEVDDLNKYV